MTAHCGANCAPDGNNPIGTLSALQAAITEAGVIHRDESEDRPAITLLAVARQVLMVLEEAGAGCRGQSPIIVDLNGLMQMAKA